MPRPETTGQATGKQGARTWFLILGFVYLLLIGVNVIGGGFKLASGGKEGAERIFAFATNPVVGVVLGAFATALIQSSSTVTSVLVGLVAGGLPVSTAVPMIMGANMGTTVTNTIVSLGSLKEGPFFKRAFQAATVHDFFNLYSILVFLPIEVIFHPLERLGAQTATLFVSGASVGTRSFNLVGMATKPVAKLLVNLLSFLPPVLAGLIMIALGIAAIIASVLTLGWLLRSVMTARTKTMIDRVIGRGMLVGILSGTLITVLVQSSSTTTSLIVPLAASGVVTLQQVYPFSLGANIGTCITALLAATAITGPSQGVALQIALVHLIYNVAGVLFFTLIPGLRRTPILTAQWLGALAARRRVYAFAYVLGIFFLLPAIVLGIQNRAGRRRDLDGNAPLSRSKPRHETGAMVHTGTYSPQVSAGL